MQCGEHLFGKLSPAFVCANALFICSKSTMAVIHNALFCSCRVCIVRCILSINRNNMAGHIELDLLAPFLS